MPRAAIAAPQNPVKFSFDSSDLSTVSCNSMIKILASSSSSSAAAAAAKLSAFRRFCGSINYLDRPVT